MDTGKATSPIGTKTAVWAVTPGGVQLGLRLCSSINGAVLFLPTADHTEDQTSANCRPYTSLSNEIGKRFNQYSAHLFVFSTGIAVRLLAPLIKSKTTDPAVVVMDEKGRFAISLLSGHLGGANEMAVLAAEITGGTPVITTATDVNQLPSIDMVAKKNGLVIETPEAIKYVNMKLLKGIPVRVYNPGNHLLRDFSEPVAKPWQQVSGCDIFCSHDARKVPRETLILRPKILSLGIGCNRGTDAEEILDLIKAVFEKSRLSLLSISAIGTSVVKRDEKGLIEAVERLDRPLEFYEREQLNQVDTVENPSEMAKKHLGVNSVCEAAAILGARKGPLLITKQKTKNVTLAVALLR